MGTVMVVNKEEVMEWGLASQINPFTDRAMTAKNDSKMSCA